jgi:Condensation domain
VNYQIPVAFDGEDAGAGDLTWGQWDILPQMRARQTSFSIGGPLPQPDGTTTGDVANELRFLLCRYPALRTRLAFTEDGSPLQVVASAGEVPLEIVDAGTNDPLAVAAEVHRRWNAQVFDETREWPVRWAAIVRGGTVTHAVPLVSHLVVDGPSMVRILIDLAERRQGAVGPVTSLQPLALARWQATPPARRKSDIALGHWERLLRAIPARRFAGLSGPRQPPYRQLCYESPAAHLASRLLAARTGTSMSTVLLAGYAMIMTRLTGISPAVVQIIASNRIRRELAGTVSPLSLPVPCVIDTAGASFGEVAGRAWRQILGTYRMSYYDPREREKLIAGIGRERGAEVDLSCYLNDLRGLSPDRPGGDLPAPAQVRAAVERSQLTWGWESEILGDRCFLSVNAVHDTLSCELYANTYYLSPAAMEACLRGLEAVLVEAALEFPAPGQRLDLPVPAG